MTTFSRTDLTRKTREVLEAAQRSGSVVIESYGKEQAVLMDAAELRLLQALAALALSPTDPPTWTEPLRRYLDEEISLGKAAELFGMSRFELMERFERLGVPLSFGAGSLEDARDEVRAARGDS